MNVNVSEVIVRTPNGTEKRLGEYQGQVLLIVNVASRCGFTKQYAGLQKLQNTYEKKGFQVLGFPCNDFGGQEPGTIEEIKDFCSSTYGASFPLFEKIRVKGRNKHSIYSWLSDPKQNGWNSVAPSWNFTKYLIDENGKLVKRFSPKSNPMSSDIIDLIK